MRSPLVELLMARRFAPLFVTQFLGAFNDNLLKSALGILVTFRLAEQAGMNAATLAMIASALFIAPFFLFSGASGTLPIGWTRPHRAMGEGRRDRDHGAGRVGVLAGEHADVAGDALLPGHAFHRFRADQIALLPQHLPEQELVAGNALIEAGTFLAILPGRLSAGASPSSEWRTDCRRVRCGGGVCRVDVRAQIPPAPPSYGGAAPRLVWCAIQLTWWAREGPAQAAAAHSRRVLVLAVRVIVVSGLPVLAKDVL